METDALRSTPSHCCTEGMKHQRGNAGGGYSEIQSNYASCFYVAADGPSSPNIDPNSGQFRVMTLESGPTAASHPGQKRKLPRAKIRKKQKQNAHEFFSVHNSPTKDKARPA